MSPPEQPKPKPVDDPLAVLIDKFSDEVEPMAPSPVDSGLESTPESSTPSAGESSGDETPTNSEGTSEATSAKA